MGARRYDHAYIEKELKAKPELALDLSPLVTSYNETHEKEPITQKALRGIVYNHYEKWLGTKPPEGRRGRPPIHDAGLVFKLLEDNPLASVQRLTRLYNQRSPTPITRNSLAYILRRRRSG